MSQGNAVNLMNMMGPRPGGNDMASQMAKLEESCKDFESVFTQKLLTVMRRTVPKNDMINGGKAEEIFTGMLDEEIAQSISEGNSLGLAKMIFDQLKEQILGSGSAQITDPRFLQLGQELVRMEAEGGEPSAEQLVQLLTPAEGEAEMELPVPPETVELPVEGAQNPEQEALMAAMKQAGPGEPGNGKIPAATADAVLQEVMAGTDAAAAELPDGMEAVTGDEADELTEAVRRMSDTPETPRNAKTGITPEGPQTAGTEDIPAEGRAAAIARSFEGKMERMETGQGAEGEETPDLKLEKAAVQRSVEGTPVAETESPESEAKQVTRRMAEQYQTAGQSDEKTGFAKRIQRNLTGSGEASGVSAVEVEEERSIDLLKNAELFKTSVKEQAAGKTQAPPDMGDMIASFEPGSRQEETAKPAFNLIAENVNARMTRMDMLDKTVQSEQVRNQTLDAEDAGKVIDQIVKKAQVLLKTGHSEMRIDLEPKHLGEVRIKVVMENDALTAKIHAKSDAVGEVIRTNLGQLGDTLKDMGFDVSSFDVSTGDDNTHSGRSGHTDQEGPEYSFADAMDESLEETDGQETGARLTGAYVAGGLSTVDLRI